MAACSVGTIGEKVSGETTLGAGLGESVSVLRNPTRGGLLTSKFGNRKNPVTGKRSPHRGIDLGAPIGTPILAAGDGTVYFLGERGSFGNLIKIQHSDHVITAYAHLSRFAPDLDAGMRVAKGQVIGFVGTTGRSSGPHLHYEVLVDGKAVDPLGTGGTRIAEDFGSWLEQTGETLTGG